MSMKGKQNSPLKKSVKRKDIEPEIKIIKHFHPTFRNHSSHQNCNLPEIDCDIDEREVRGANKTSGPRSRSVGTNKNNVIANKIEIKLQKLKSKSLIEDIQANSNSKFSFSSSSSNWLPPRIKRNHNVIADKIEKKLDKFKTTKYSEESSNSITSNLKCRPLGTNRNSVISNKQQPKLKEVKDDQKASRKVSKLTYVHPYVKGGDKNPYTAPIFTNFRSGREQGTKHSLTSSSDLEGVRSVSIRSRKSKSCTEGRRVKENKEPVRSDPPVDHDIGENYVQCLRKEIRLNKFGTEKRQSVGDSSTETIDRLREEILKFIKTNDLEKKQCITELKAEIAEFRSDGRSFQVYQVSDIRRDAEQEESSVRNTVEQNVTSANVDTGATVPTEFSSSSSLEYAREVCLEGDAGDRIDEVQLGLGTSNSKQSPERIINENIENIRMCSPNIIESSSTDDITTKIIQANLLINRVKETLDEIKAKSASATPKDVFTFGSTKLGTTTDSDKENLETTIAKSQEILEKDRDVSKIAHHGHISLSEKVTEIILDDLARPETRRGMRPKIPDELEEKFRTTPPDQNMVLDTEDHEMELLHAKLDAISEKTDSEGESSLSSVPATTAPSSTARAIVKETTSAACNTEEPQVTAVATTDRSCNTEPVNTHMRQTQTAPTGIKVSGTQCVCETEEKTAQTEKPTPIKIKVSGTQSVYQREARFTQTENSITLNAKKGDTMEITPHQTRNETRLHVQLLAPINIRSSMVSQMALHFSIDAYGQTNVYNKNISANISFIELKSTNLPENKVKLDIGYANKVSNNIELDFNDLDEKTLGTSEKPDKSLHDKTKRPTSKGSEDNTLSKGERKDGKNLSFRSDSDEILKITSISEIHEFDYEIEIPMRDIEKRKDELKSDKKYIAQAYITNPDKGGKSEKNIDISLKPRAIDINEQSIITPGQKNRADEKKHLRKTSVTSESKGKEEGLVRKAVSKLEKEVLKTEKKIESPPNDFQNPIKDIRKKTTEPIVSKPFEESKGIQTVPEVVATKTIQVVLPKPELKDITTSASTSTFTQSVDLQMDKSNVADVIMKDYTGQTSSRHPSDSKRHKRRNISGTESETSDKELILKSYHIYDNVNAHDPGILTTSSYDLMGVIDEDVYRTYINPQGYTPPPKYELNKVSSSNFDPSRKIIKLDNIASLRNLDKTCESDVETLNSSVMKETGLSHHALEYKKLWDIGLYATKSTQFSQQGESHTKTSQKCRSSDPMQSYESLSFTISYSTEESLTPDSSLNVISQVGSDHFKSQVFNTERLPSQDPRFRKSLPHLGEEEHNVLKNLKDKLSKNVPTTQEEEDPLEDVGSMIANDRSLSEFIVGLTGSEKIKRVTQQARKSLQSKSNSKHRHKDFDVLPVQISGNFISRDQDFCNPLAQGENGRYKDEENLFREIEKLRHKRKRLEFFMKPRNKHTHPNPINSDTMSTDKSISEGEVKCHCCISLGEVHRCRFQKHAFDRSPRRSFELDGFKTVRQKRTYFNNCITYYVNDTSSSINNTSISTSNT